MKKLSLGKDSDSQFLGVCSGLAEYTGEDVTIIRIIALIIMCSTVGLLPYFICWIAMPYHPEDEQEETHQ